MRRDRKLALITWFGGLALIVQAMLPLLLAIEFRAAAIEAPYLTATDDAICGPGHDGSPHSDHPDHKHATCAICIALAAAQAFTTPPQIAAPLPRIVATVDGDLLPAAALAALDTRPYQARAPPLNS